MQHETDTSACKGLTIAVAAILISSRLSVLQTQLLAEDIVVIPSTFLAAHGGQAPKSRQNDDETAFAFPSLLPGDAAQDSVTCSMESFFASCNKFPAKATFSWWCGSRPWLRIVVERSPNDPLKAIFSIDRDSLTQLRSRDWPKVRLIQCRFRSWLIAKSRCGCFNGLNEKLSQVWIEHFLKAARFDLFAYEYLNKPESFEVQASGHDRLIGRHEISDAWKLGRILAFSKDPFSRKVFSCLPVAFQTRTKEFCDQEGATPSEEQLAQFATELRKSLNELIQGPPQFDESQLPENVRARLPKDLTLRTVAVNRAALNAAFPMIASPLRMWATPLRPREVLDIAWGSTAVYPFKGEIPGVPDSYSRMTTVGVTRLHITASRYGIALFPRGTKRMSSDTQTSVDNEKGQLPFPRNWAELIETTFVPIYNMHDLLNDRLLVSESNNPTDRKLPTYLFLLSPQRYIKADSPNTKTNFKQYSTDARRQGDAEELSDSLEQLARRYIVVGCDQNSPEAVEAEFNRLICAAKNLSGPANDLSGVGEEPHLYPMAIFANQTALSIGRHVVISKRSQTEVRSRLATWAQVVGESNLSALRKVSSRPLLDVIRTTCSETGVPTQGLRVRFHTTHPYVLDAAQVGEGDEFVIKP